MKRTKKKGIEAQRVKPSNPTQATDAHSDEKKRIEWKTEEKQLVSNPATPDYLVTSHDPHGSDSGLIMNPLPTNYKRKLRLVVHPIHSM